MSTALVKFYKGVVLVQIHSKIVADGAPCSIDEVDQILKNHADAIGSCKDMSTEELKELIEHSKQFGAQIGVDIDKNNGIELNYI